MANPEHLAILKQGVKVWNRWRDENPEIEPDLSLANLQGKNLSGINFSLANLRGALFAAANLSSADLQMAKISHALLPSTNFREANLLFSSLNGADLTNADMKKALLRGAYLNYAHLFGTSLVDANLDGAKITNAVFSSTNLRRTILSGVHAGKTIFSNLDLREVEGLNSVKHVGPSTIGIDTIISSRGQIPEEFLRGCGLPDEFIDYIPSLLSQPIQYYSCFISYSSQDQEFCERLYADLQNHGVRCWFAPEDLKIGDKIRHAIDLSIRHHDKLMLVLSEQSIASQWVEKEVETAFEKERQQQRTVLFPLMLDRAVFDAEEAWAADIRRIRHIGDFTNWKNHDDYKKALDRLLRDLKAGD